MHRRQDSFRTQCDHKDNALDGPHPAFFGLIKLFGKIRASAAGANKRGGGE